MRRVRDVPLKKDHRWMFDQYLDGTQQWVFHRGSNEYHYVERELLRGSKERRKWHIVDRECDEAYANDFPPLLYGPFEDIRAAMLAVELLYS